MRAYGQVRIGDPLDPQTLMGPLVDADAVDDMLAALDQIARQGGEVLTGGRRRTDLGPQFVEPAIVRMPAQTAIVQRETFAPILYAARIRLVRRGASRCTTACRRDCRAPSSPRACATAEEFLSARGTDCGIANVNIGTRGRDRRRVRRREGDGRGTRSRGPTPGRPTCGGRRTR